jgi:Leucine-rich repeat (LRR) protein
MFKVKLSLLILVLMSPLTQATTDCAAVTEIQETECEALVAFYNSTNGDNWEDNSGWLETNTPCSWKGVTCSGGHVSEIDLYNNRLGGTIPTELGNLSNLKYLSLSSNSLTGSIPTELGNLSNLKYLSLLSNSLTGTIPTELGNLSNLRELYLYDNKLTSSIPSELGNLSKLKYLYLHGNSLTGTIPTELGNLSKLRCLFLFSNKLTGTIPTELGNLSQLTEFFLHSNSLTGTIPTELSNLSNLKFLHLDDNQLCGKIPSKLKKLSNISLPNNCWRDSCLKLDNNHLTATGTQLIAWLDSHNPGWDETQTTCPQQQSKLQFSGATYSVAEDSRQITITVTRANSSDGAVSIEYATSDGTAIAPNDYIQSTGILYWNDGDDDDKTFTVAINDDTISESDESFNLTLTNATGGAILGEPNTATVTIEDDDKSFNCKKVTEIPKKECEALIALYDSTNGENWVDNTGWKTTNEPCNWNGVDCQKKRVTGLSLENNNLYGSISKDFFKLKKLESLILSDNNFDSTSLNNLKKLKNLETLLIDNCKLTGKIPNSLMKLKNLEELDLNDNCLKTKVSKKLKKWLDELNPGWDETQTDCQ